MAAKKKQKYVKTEKQSNTTKQITWEKNVIWVNWETVFLLGQECQNLIWADDKNLSPMKLFWHTGQQFCEHFKSACWANRSGLLVIPCPHPFISVQQHASPGLLLVKWVYGQQPASENSSAPAEALLFCSENLTHQVRQREKFKFRKAKTLHYCILFKVFTWRERLSLAPYSQAPFVIDPVSDLN